MKTEPRILNVEGKEIPVFVADINSQIPMAIVSQNVLGYLTRLLPRVPLTDIKKNLVDRVYDAKDIGQYTDLLREELEFHESVNILKEFFIEPVKSTGNRLREDIIQAH